MKYVWDVPRFRLSAAVCCYMQDSESDPKAALRPPGHGIEPRGYPEAIRIVWLSMLQAFTNRDGPESGQPDPILVVCPWNNHGICMGYPLNMHRIYMEYQWNINGVSMEYPWNIHGICIKDVWNIH